MNKQEFEDELDRLAKGFNYEMTEEKSRAYWERFGHLELRVWKEAVRHSLMSPRFPIEDHLADLCERAANAYHAHEVQSSNHDAKKFFNSTIVASPGQPIEADAYNKFRMMSILCALKSDDYDQTIVDYLTGYVENEYRARWAESQPSRGLKGQVQTLLDTLLEEIVYYEQRVAEQERIRKATRKPLIGRAMEGLT